MIDQSTNTLYFNANYRFDLIASLRPHRTNLGAAIYQRKCIERKCIERKIFFNESHKSFENSILQTSPQKRGPDNYTRLVLS